MTGMRTRLLIFAAVLVIATGGAVYYVLQTRRDNSEAANRAPAVPVGGDLSAISAAPHLMFRSTALGEGYGRVAVVPLTATDGPRAFTPASCERVHATREGAVCLLALRGLATTYQVKMFGPNWVERSDRPLAGLPSRARLSRDGRLASTTTFVFGDSYTTPGQFSTRTVVSRTDGGTAIDIEGFDLVVDGKIVNAVDKNLWGVTFIDDDAFYATAASGKKTWLVKGSLAAKRVTAVRQDVECPSLSPDATRIAFKKHGNLPSGQWRLSVLELATGKITELAETTSVDDQAEWLDDSTVAYGLSRTADGVASSDIWAVPADGTGAPRKIVVDAWSPAVIR